MNELTKSNTEEIIKLHNEISMHYKISIQNAIRIGEILTEQKKSLKYGEFTKWVESTLPFTSRTARNYMLLFKEKSFIKTETVSDLSEAYKLLSQKRDKETHRQEIIDKHDKVLEDYKQHPTPIGKVFYDIFGAGWKCKISVTGGLEAKQNITLPIHTCECIDPKYHKLKEKEAPKELILMYKSIVQNIQSALGELKEVSRTFEKICKDFGNSLDCNTYFVDWDAGIIYLLAELVKQYEILINCNALKEIKKVKKTMSELLSKFTEEDILLLNEKRKGKYYTHGGMREGWSAWGLEAYTPKTNNQKL